MVEVSKVSDGSDKNNVALQKAAAAAKSKAKRRKHKNSHNGCKNCKQRRIKCDETLPECTNCIKLAQSRTAVGATYTRCSYFELSEEELEAMRAKSEPITTAALRGGGDEAMSKSISPIPRPGIPLNSSTRVGHHELKVYPNKSPYFKEKFAIFRRLSEMATVDLKTVADRATQVAYLKIHLTKMLLLSSVADIYFVSLLSFTCNYLKRNIYKLETLFNQLSLRYFGDSIRCQKKLISNLATLTPCHYNYLTSSTMILSWNTIYQETELHAYSSFTMGMISIISSGIRMADSHSPNTTSMKAAAENILQSFKSCFFPSYKPDFLEEIYRNLLSLQSRSIEFENLVLFLNQLITEIHENAATLTTLSNSTVVFIYKVLTDWYSILPSQVYNLGHRNFEMDPTKQIIMCYYITVGQALLAVFPESAFMFSIEFLGIGSLDMSYAFFPSSTPSSPPSYHLTYLSRVYNFFRTRQNILFDEIAFKSLEPLSHLQSFEKGLKLTSIHEKPIKEFNSTVIRPEHYPYTNPNETGTDNNDGILMMTAIQTYDEDINQLLNNLTYREVNLHDMLLDFNAETGFLNQDHIPIQQVNSYGPVTANLTSPQNLELVYRIRMSLLHS